MNQAVENTNTETTETVVANTETVVAKAPSLKSRATEIFRAKLVERQQGLFGTNKEFRAAVLSNIMNTLQVSVASAATMYNSAKKEAEAADATIKLGRDPKKEKVKSATGRRGRPAGSKNRAKNETVVATVEVTEPAAETAVTEPAAEAVS